MREQILLKNKGYFSFENLPDLNLICAFSLRTFGNMSLLYGDIKNALNNRNNFLGCLGIDYKDLVCARQVHGSFIKYVQETDRGKGALSYDTAVANTDAFITDQKNLPLAIFTADCLSIFLYDTQNNSIGLIHAGWRSSQEKIVAKTIQLMQGKFNTQTKDLYIGFGPAIRSCCYEVGEDFKQLFSGELIQRNGHYYLDLLTINKIQLLDLGVKETNIFDSKICTSCQNKTFFSYRKDGKSCGRMMSVVMLK
jgi:YfiH family protein